jgi:hypothetical protein
MASRQDIMRLLQRESASEGGALVGGGMTGGCMDCPMCQGAGLVGGRITGLAKKYPKLNQFQIEKMEKDFIAQAMERAPQFKTKKDLADFIKRTKYELAGLPVPVRGAPKPKKARTAKQQEATAKMLVARAEAQEVAKAWRARVASNPKCDNVTIMKLMNPNEIAKLRQRLETYDL